MLRQEGAAIPRPRGERSRGEASGSGNCKQADALDQRKQVMENEVGGVGGARLIGFCKHG